MYVPDSLAVCALKQGRVMMTMTIRAAFYLILDVAVGGTNGWFPDNAGNKPWLDGALSVSCLDSSTMTAPANVRL